MTVRLGLNAKLYRNTGSYGTPTWTEIEAVKDLSLADAMTEADVTARKHGGYRAMVAALREVGIEFDMPNIVADVDLLALRTAYNARSTIEFAVMDDAIATSGAHGVRFSGQIFQRNRDEKLEEAQMYAWTIKPTDSDNAPSEVTTA